MDGCLREEGTNASLLSARRLDPQTQAAQIQPTELAITLVFVAGSPDTGGWVIANRQQKAYSDRWRHRLSAIGGRGAPPDPPD